MTPDSLPPARPGGFPTLTLSLAVLTFVVAVVALIWLTL